MPKVTTRRQIDSPRKNQLVGAIKAHGNVSRAAREYDIALSTARDIWKKFQNTGTTANQHRSGRPALFCTEEKAQIVEYAKEHRRKPFRDIGNEIAAQASASTIRNIVAEEGYHRRVAQKSPYLSEATKRKRLAWAEQQKADMGPADWRNVAWSDEAYVCLDDLKGRVYVTRRPGEEHLEECCVPSLTQSPLHVMVWGVIMKGIKGPLVILEYPGGKGGGMTAQRYIDQVLSGPLTKFYKKMKHSRPLFQFQQDGAPSHRGARR